MTKNINDKSNQQIRNNPDEQLKDINSVVPIDKIIKNADDIEDQPETSAAVVQRRPQFRYNENKRKRFS